MEKLCNWFECKVKYEKTLENGMAKKVSEPYLVEAVSFTEAEKRFIQEIQPFMSGEYEVDAVAKRKFAEIFDTKDKDADRWYKVKVVFITLDEKTGIEKKTNRAMLVKASDLRDAVKRFDKGMEGTITDYDIISIQETLIVDLFRYDI